MYEAGCSEVTGRVIEPRNKYSRGPFVDNLSSKPKGKADGLHCPEGSSPGSIMNGDAFRTPPGSESGACDQRGNSETGESRLSPGYMTGLGDRLTKGPGKAKS